MADTHLEFNLSVIGVEKVSAALASIEARFIKMRASLDKILSKETAAAAKTVANQSRIAAAAQRAEIQLTALKAREEQKLHAQKMRDEEKYKQARIKNELQIANAVKKANQAKTTYRNAGRGARDTFGGFAGRAAATVGASATGIAYAAGRDQLTADRVAGEIANSAYKNPGEKRSLQELKASALGTMRTESLRTGLSREEIGATMQAGTAATGDLAGVTKLLPMINDVRQAFGVTAEEAGTLAGKLWDTARSSSEFKTDAERIDFVTKALRTLGMQGKVGSIELKALAGNWSKFQASLTMFSGTEFEKLQAAGAMGQLAMKGGASSAEEAATASQRFAATLIEKGGKIAAATGGYNPVKNNKIQGNPVQIASEIVKRSKGDLKKLTSIFGEEDIKMMMPFIKAYNETKGGKKDKNKAVDSLADEFKTELSDKDVTAMAKNARGGLEAELSSIWNEIKVLFGDELAPVIRNSLIPALKEAAPDIIAAGVAFAKIAPTVAKVGELLLNMPLSAFAVMLKTHTGSLGESLQKYGTNLGAFGKALDVAGVGLISFIATMEALGVLFADSDKITKEQQEARLKLINAQAIKDPEKRTEALNKIKEELLARDKEIAENNSGVGGWFRNTYDALGSTVAYHTGLSDQKPWLASENQLTEQLKQKIELERQQLQALRENTDATKEATAKAGGNGTTPSLWRPPKN